MDDNIKRTVGFAAIRQMANLAKEIKAEEQRNSQWLKRFLMFLGAVALSIVVIFTFSPGTISNVLRTIAGIFL
jgi:hypothetical protein